MAASEIERPVTIPDQDSWEAWTPAELAGRLAGIGRPWCVVGGWALDLWHGEPTRTHEDLEFTVLRADIDRFRVALAGLDFYTVADGVLQFLPADAAPPADIFQIWCRDVAAGRWRADMMIEPGTDECWIYKRDPSIIAPRAAMVSRSAAAIPYLMPVAVLLFKARHCRPKDQSDFDLALPKLGDADRTWLRQRLTTLHPEHDWIDRL